MKLWKKLSLVTIIILLLSTGISGGAVIWQSALYNQEKTVENYEQQLTSTAYALGRELSSGALEDYSRVARNSYLNFLIKKFGASRYILIEKGQTVCNLTPYEFADSGDERWNSREACSVIQSRDGSHVLITGKEVPTDGNLGFSLVLVQDISFLYEDIRSQALFFLTIYLLAALLSVAFVFLITGRLLKPLGELKRAAQDISAGQLERRALVRTRDEVGVVAESFNQMAQQIEAQMTELSQVSERRRQLLGSLAHELKTPMTSIIGYSETLLNVNLKKDQQERALLHIHEECRRLERLSSKLMSLMGLYENDSISMEEVPMEEVFSHVAEVEAVSLQRRQLGLVTSCSMGSRKIDRDLFESLLMNLIDNGAKASRAGDVIYLKGEKDRIIVQDQGCGIQPGELSRVKEAFYMVDKARSRKAGGCGLGLALCDRIAELHGAGIFIESEPEKGTVVSVVFEREPEG